jgi:hypothetical protein
MTKAERQSSFGTRVPGGPSVSGEAMLMACAGLLILLGIVFQLAVLGYGHINAGDFWLVSVIATNLWGVAAEHLNLPALQEIFTYWPLLLVCTGFVMLLALKQGGRRLAGSSARKDNAHGE